MSYRPRGSPDRIHELFGLGLKQKVLYFHVDHPPHCQVCGESLVDELFVHEGPGLDYCLDHWKPKKDKTRTAALVQAYLERWQP